MTETNPDYRIDATALIFHIVFWLAAFFFWLFFTQANHPNWTLRILCTWILVDSSALFACFFSPRQFKPGPLFRSALLLAICGTAAALLIHVFYDALLGPDPLRFSLLSNIAMDIAFVLVNTLISAIVAALFTVTTGRPVWRIIVPTGSFGETRSSQ